MAVRSKERDQGAEEEKPVRTVSLSVTSVPLM